MSHWEKIGFYRVSARPELGICSHAQLPTALVMNEQRVRVYFAARDEHQHSAVHFVDMLIHDDEVSFVEPRVPYPVLKGGGIGTFEEHGVYPSCVVASGGKYYMYYIGWNQGTEAPLFYASIGIAVSIDGLNFHKLPGPILSRGEHDPCLVTSPHVYIDEDLWRMTYVSGVRWSRNADGRLQSHYHIKYAESDDGIQWRRNGDVAIDFVAGETNIARSAVVKCSDDDYRMWYSFVHSDIGKYRIGYAESRDGTSWERKDHLAGISIGDEFATQMICYPCVFTLGNDVYMLYNGDNFGKLGFGIAVLRGR